MYPKSEFELPVSNLLEKFTYIVNNTLSLGDL